MVVLLCCCEELAPLPPLPSLTADPWTVALLSSTTVADCPASVALFAPLTVTESEPATVAVFAAMAAVSLAVTCTVFPTSAIVGEVIVTESFRIVMWLSPHDSVKPSGDTASIRSFAYALAAPSTWSTADAWPVEPDAATTTARWPR